MEYQRAGVARNANVLGIKKDLPALLDIVFDTAGEARTTIDTGTDTAADTCLRQKSGFTIWQNSISPLSSLVPAIFHHEIAANTNPNEYSQ